MRNRRIISVFSAIFAVAFAVTPAAAQAASPDHYFSGGIGNASRIEGGERVPTIAWGTLSLTNLTTGSKVVCHYIIGAVVENPAPGGEAGPAGVSETQSSDSYECEEQDEDCPVRAIGIVGGGPASYISVFAEGSRTALPETGTGTMTAANPAAETPEEPLAASGTNLRWKSHLLTEGTRIRQETERVRLDVICHLQPCCEPEDFNAEGEPDFEPQFPEVLQGSYKPRAMTRCCTKGVAGEFEFDAESGTLENSQDQKTKVEGRLKTLGFDNQEIINSREG